MPGKKNRPEEPVAVPGCENRGFWIVQAVLNSFSAIIGTAGLIYCSYGLYKDIHSHIFLAGIPCSLTILITALRASGMLMHFASVLRRNRLLEAMHHGAMSISAVTEFIKQDRRQNEKIDDFLNSVNRDSRASSTKILELSKNLMEVKETSSRMYDELAEMKKSLAEQTRKAMETALELQAKASIPVSEKEMKEDGKTDSPPPATGRKTDEGKGEKKEPTPRDEKEMDNQEGETPDGTEIDGKKPEPVVPSGARTKSGRRRKPVKMQSPDTGERNSHRDSDEKRPDDGDDYGDGYYGAPEGF